MRLTASVLLLGAFLMAGCPTPDGEQVLISLDRKNLPPNLKQNNADAAIIRHIAAKGADSRFRKVDRGKFTLTK